MIQLGMYIVRVMSTTFSPDNLLNHYTFNMLPQNNLATKV